MRKRLYEIIEVANASDGASNIYDIFMMISIVASLIPLCTKSAARWTSIIDIITVTIFIIDYLLREMTADYKYSGLKWKAFFRYPFSFMAIVDLLAIIPSFGIFTQGLKVFKVFRLFRTFKVFKTIKAVRVFKALKIVRYSKSLKLIAEVIKKQKDALLMVVVLAAGYIFIAALIVFNVEPESFANFFDAIYWACVSLTTVGYGDIYPVSTAGRIVTMISSVAGIAIVAMPSSIITAGYMAALQHRDEELQD